jgi:hypothetical protein
MLLDWNFLKGNAFSFGLSYDRVWLAIEHQYRPFLQAVEPRVITRQGL